MSSILFNEPLSDNWPTRDPFLFCRHHTDYFPIANNQMAPNVSLEGRQIGNDFSSKDGWSMYYGDVVPGFPAHPHRGFETITIVEEGIVDHADSAGNTGRYGFGDVQWMTAGAGIQHSEMSPLLDKNNANPKESFQIWLNLPKINKLVDPEYKMMWHEDIPTIVNEDSFGRSTAIKLIAGTWEGKSAIAPPSNSWAADKQHHVSIWKITMSPLSTITLPKTVGRLTRDLYFFHGDKLNIDTSTFDEYQLVGLDSSIETTLSAGESSCEILILQGLPINEPIAQHGPFVMNNSQELNDAFIDFERSQFGGWPWSQPGVVHDREQPRFSWQGGLSYSYPPTK
ncbi:pirin family protein [Vibrio sp. E150_011]